MRTLRSVVLRHPESRTGFISPWKIQSHPPPSISTPSVCVRAKAVVGLPAACRSASG